MNNSEFILKAKEIHGDKYDYSLVDYKYYNEKVKFLCKKHGVFYQTPNSHLCSKGCPDCSYDKLRNLDFEKRAKEIHGDKYDYSLCKYKNNKLDMQIICKIHGIFLQNVVFHINRKYGCPKCGGTAKLSKTEFIDKSLKIHKDNYIYEFVDYVNSSTKVKIICKKHGEFLQRPNQHLRGDGCPRCNQSKGESKGESKIREYLEKNNFFYEDQAIFESCKDKRVLPFDFLVRIEQQKFLIEFQGEHHYKLVNFSKDKNKAKMKFEKTQYHDFIKKEWCELNNIPLLIIPWNTLDIDEALNKFLSKG